MVIRRIHTKINRIDDAELIMLKKRVDMATLVIITFIALLIARLWFLQIHKGEEYEQQSLDNRVREQQIAAPRGNLYDRHDRLMVANRPCFNVVWMRDDAPHPEEVLRRLAKILDVDINILLDRIRTGSELAHYVPIRLQEDIDWKTLVYIENHRFSLPGVRIEVRPTRNYLYGDLSSHMIGYLGEISKRELQEREDGLYYQGGDQIGKTGIEKRYEEELRGEKGRSLVEVDVHNFEQQRLEIQEPLPGNDLQLTIDVDLQQVAENSLLDQAGAVVAMEVETGRLLVLASSPSLPLSEWLGGISTDAWQKLLTNPFKPLINKPIQGAYAPGSTYKIITAMAALSEGVVTPETVFYCSGSMNFGNRNYGCWKRRGHGAITLRRALAESCDVYFYLAGQKVGVDGLARYAESFGLGALTGIELEQERSGLVPTSEWKKRKHQEAWQEGETLSVAIGQGFNTTTPLQICRMTAATANGGLLFRPQIIQEIRDPDGKVLRAFQPIAEGRILGGKRALQLITDGLVAAVNDKNGTGEQAKLDGVTVAGKTGTAQVVHLSHHRHLPEEEIPYKFRDHAWFTCFAPAEKPEIAVTVLVEHGRHGGSTAAPIARAILERYFRGPVGEETGGGPRTHYSSGSDL